MRKRNQRPWSAEIPETVWESEPLRRPSPSLSRPEKNRTPRPARSDCRSGNSPYAASPSTVNDAGDAPLESLSCRLAFRWRTRSAAAPLAASTNAAVDASNAHAKACMTHGRRRGAELSITNKSSQANGGSRIQSTTLSRNMVAFGCHAHGSAWACPSANRHAHPKLWAWHPAFCDRPATTGRKRTGRRSPAGRRNRVDAYLPAVFPSVVFFGVVLFPGVFFSVVFFSIFAHVSRRLTVRLNTKAPGRESFEST